MATRFLNISTGAVALLVALLATYTGSAKSAAAQPGSSPAAGEWTPPPRSTPKKRAGVFLGFGAAFGVAESNLSDCTTCKEQPVIATGGLDFHLGLRFHPRVAALAEFSSTMGGGTPDGLLLEGQHSAMLVGQVWVLPKLWIKAGYGVSAYGRSKPESREIDQKDHGTGRSIMAAIGYEAVFDGSFVMSPFVKAQMGFYDRPNEENLGIAMLGIDFTWSWAWY